MTSPPAKTRPYYPIFLDIEGRRVVIVGGGNVCARKAETMLNYGAVVTVVAPEATGEIEAWAREGRLTLHRKGYEAGDVDGAHIVIASTDDPAVNERVAADCRERRIPVNVVDVTPLCEFIVPAIVEKGSVQIAISTGGRSPALARTLKEDLGRLVGPEYGEVNDLLGSLRENARRVLPADVDRKAFFDGIIAAGVLDLVRKGDRRAAMEAMADACLRSGVELSEALRAALERERVSVPGP